MNAIKMGKINGREQAIGVGKSTTIEIPNDITNDELVNYQWITLAETSNDVVTTNDTIFKISAISKNLEDIETVVSESTSSLLVHIEGNNQPKVIKLSHEQSDLLKEKIRFIFKNNKIYMQYYKSNPCNLDYTVTIDSKFWNLFASTDSISVDEENDTIYEIDLIEGNIYDDLKYQVDKTTGKKYQLGIDNGEIFFEEV